MHIHQMVLELTDVVLLVRDEYHAVVITYKYSQDNDTSFVVSQRSPIGKRQILNKG